MESYYQNPPFFSPSYNSTSSSSSSPSHLLSLNNTMSSRVFGNEFEGNNNKESVFLGSNKSTEIMMQHESKKTNGNNLVVGSDESDDQLEKFGNKSKKGENKKMKKARYAFQTRSQVDILDDGYRWRKYGQKAVKNNKFPRSYYRCTHQGCNVKKQVQRLTKDEGIVVTTYEGMHSHPIQKSTDNFEHILAQMQIFSSF